MTSSTPASAKESESTAVMNALNSSSTSSGAYARRRRKAAIRQAHSGAPTAMRKTMSAVCQGAQKSRALRYVTEKAAGSLAAVPSLAASLETAE